MKHSNPAKDYLSQAYRIDQRINSKLEQVASLRALATKATGAIQENPVSHTRDVHSLESTIAKIVDLEKEINADIDSLVDTKCEIVGVIKAVASSEYQTLLEMRYLCFKTWEQIAVALDHDVRWVYSLHDKALAQAAKIISGGQQEKSL